MLAELTGPAVLEDVRVDVGSVVVRLALLHVAEAVGHGRCRHDGRCACTVVADRCSPDRVAGVLVVRDEPLACQDALDAVLAGLARSVIVWDEPQSLVVALDAMRQEATLVSNRVLLIAGSAPRLSDRQRETLRLVAMGRSNGEIAARLHQSLSTAKREIAELLGLFDAPNRAALMSTASALGLDRRSLVTG